MIKAKWVFEANEIIYSKGQLDEAKELFITTDSRKLEGKNTYIALYGDKFDGFSFVDKVIEKENIEVVLFEDRENRKALIEKWKNDYPTKSFVAVKDIFSFILDLASVSSIAFKDRGGKLIGLTGSNGKTTNKEMLASLISSAIGEKRVHYTKGNLNNHIGVPLTIFDIEEDHEVAIIEMGTNHLGEIEILCKAANPDYGMITNIGHAHIEYLKSLDGVLEEKASLYRAIEKSNSLDKVFVLNGFDEKLSTLEIKNWVKVVNAENVNLVKNSFKIDFENKSYEISNPSLIGEHQQINMAMGLRLSLELYPSKKEALIKAANTFQLKGMNRGEIREIGEIKVYLDAYNANPSSMQASLASFSGLLEKESLSKDSALLILGDMNEVGELTQKLHRDTARKAHEMGFENFIFVGRFAEYYNEGCSSGIIFEDGVQLAAVLKEYTDNKKFIFIKGSRSLQLESILDIYKD